MIQYHNVEGGIKPVEITKRKKIALDKRRYQHRVLADIPFVTNASVILKTIRESKGWDYKVNKEHYMIRDQALVSFIYVTSLRISEIVSGDKDSSTGIKKNQLMQDIDGSYYIEGVKLVKEKFMRKGKPVLRKHSYREKVRLPIEGERKPFTDMILKWTSTIDENEYLFKMTRQRAYVITSTMTGVWNHWFRMVGENYLWKRWGKNSKKLADYLQVNETTLIHYLRDSFDDMPNV